MNRWIIATFAATWWAVSGPPVVADAPLPLASEPSAEVGDLVQQLSRPSFIQRDWATRRLVQRGPDIVPQLVNIVRETTDRDLSTAVVQLLANMSRNRDLALAASALRGLSSLHDNPAGLPAETRSIIGTAFRDAVRHNVAELTALGAEIERDEAQRIDRITVRSERFNDQHMPLVSAFTTVTTLHLRNTSITGESLPHLASLVNLERLNLTDTRITGDDLRQLPSLPQLRQLSLYRVPLSDADRRWLHDHLPHCQVNP